MCVNALLHIQVLGYSGNAFPYAQVLGYTGNAFPHTQVLGYTGNVFLNTQVLGCMDSVSAWAALLVVCHHSGDDSQTWCGDKTIVTRNGADHRPASRETCMHVSELVKPSELHEHVYLDLHTPRIRGDSPQLGIPP